MLDNGDTASISLGEPEKAPTNGKIKVRLICPLYEVFEMEADSVLLPGAEGDILILPERAPIFVYLKAGRMIIYNQGQKPISYFVSAGVSEVRRNLCPVLAWGVREDKVNPEKIAVQLAESEVALGALKSDMAKREIISRIDFFKTILRLMDYQPAETVDKPKSRKKPSFNPYQLKVDK
ncbi:MAG: F0F1 ATP synthase subunit epsilon [Alphaproteobacteria bacterium]|nr:F0F1 ATP synthase subunit epsilon [Alphaproteobacteria bacterium]